MTRESPQSNPRNPSNPGRHPGARLVRPLQVVAVLYLAYLALMTVVAMPALNLLAPRLYRAETGRELLLDKIILLNPFTLSVTVRSAASDNPDHSRLWSFDRLYIDLSLSSLWRRQLVLDEVQLQGLYVQADQTGAGRYSFSDILDYRAAHAGTPAAAPAKTELFPVSIKRIALAAKHLGMRAPHLAEPMAFEVGDLSIGIDDFSTVALNRGADPTLAPAAPAVHIEPIAPLHSGAIQVDIGHIKTDFLREQQPFAAQIDALQFAMQEFAGAAQPQHYRLNARPHAGGELRVEGRFDLAQRSSDGTVHIAAFNLVPPWHYLAPKLAFETQRGLLDAELPYRVQWGEALRYAVDNGHIALRELQLQSQRDADTQLGVGSLRVDGIGVDSEQHSVRIAAIGLDGLVLHGWSNEAQISLRDMFQFQSDDESNSTPWQVEVDDIVAHGGEMRWRTQLLDVPELTAAPLELHARNVRWPEPKDAQLELATRVNNDTRLAVAGTLNLANRTGRLGIDIEGLPLQWGNRLLGEQIAARLQSGSASAHVDLALDQGEPTTMKSDGHIDRLELQRLPDQQKLAAWQRLEWKKLAVNLPARKLRIERIDALKPWLQFRLNADGTNNFQQLTAQRQPASSPRRAPAAAPQRPAAQDARPWQFAIGTFHSENGLLDFRDATLARAFHTTIADFTGDVQGLGNRANAPAKIAFKGTVDGYAPVALTGTANPFAATPALDVALDITNLDLSTLTPYSGTYAGYLINGGRLSVQLAYKLKDGRVQGTNHIVVNQLELGEQVHGPKVMDLPLRFAIYLLTDANGVMDLGVDVTGNVDDPDFSVASIIWKAFRNVIVKTATSPFRALGRLVGGGADQDLDRIDFHAGSDHMRDGDRRKLDSLSEALQKKSALRLTISGHVSPGQDIEGLRDNSLSADLIAQSRIAEADIRDQTTGWQDAVAKLYRKRFPADTSGKLTTMQMNDSMRDNVELDPRALDELASRRALAVKQALVAERGLAADRAAVAPVDLGTDKNPGLHATMALE